MFLGLFNQFGCVYKSTHIEFKLSKYKIVYILLKSQQLFLILRLIAVRGPTTEINVFPSIDPILSIILNKWCELYSMLSLRTEVLHTTCHCSYLLCFNLLFPSIYRSSSTASILWHHMRCYLVLFQEYVQFIAIFVS